MSWYLDLNRTVELDFIIANAAFEGHLADSHVAHATWRNAAVWKIGSQSLKETGLAVGLEEVFVNVVTMLERKPKRLRMLMRTFMVTNIAE